MNDSITSQGTLVTAGQEEIQSFRHKEDGTIELVVIVHSQISTWPGISKTAKKKIYKAEDGEIVLAEEIEGKVIPKKTIPEKIAWEDK